MKTIVNKPENSGKSSRSFFAKSTEASFFTKQAKLNVGQPDDKYEQEADRVADQVVNGQSNAQGFFAPAQNSVAQTKLLAESIAPLVQKQEEEEEAQTKPENLNVQRDKEEEEPQAKLEIQRQSEEEEEEEALQAKMTNNSEQKRSDNTEQLLADSKGGGSPLNSAVRAEMENGFGTDFSNVKIHTNSRAVQMNKDLGARAFTSGNDIYFNTGNYQPESHEGKKLLAHELTHTIQQAAARPGNAMPVQRDTGTVETSEGIEEIEGMTITSSAEEVRARLLAEQAVINSTIDGWVRENFDFVATSMRTAAESFENWYSAHSASDNSTFVFDVISGGLGILSAAYPPAGLAAAILGAVVNIAKTARDSQNAANSMSQGSAAVIVEQSMINKSEQLRNSSVGFAERLKSRNETIWNNAGVGITLHDPSVALIAKAEFYAAVGIEPPSANLTQIALSNMIHAYTNWERGNSLRDSVLFVSSEDLEWAFQDESQRRRIAERRARQQLEIGNSE